ncbi:hypothetical protein, partial [Dapis sp. BLCC M229]|uniref:hypothetical protein n=1 Tax=Dapis sp. BLCC M229 TaxID=3400188 RepID=UPI003CF27A6F
WDGEVSSPYPIDQESGRFASRLEQDLRMGNEISTFEIASLPLAMTESGAWSKMGWRGFRSFRDATL